MPQEVAPIAVRRELASLDAAAPPNPLSRLKREELALMGSVALHELYFANPGGFRRAGSNSGLGRPGWHEVPDDFAAEIAADGTQTAVDSAPVLVLDMYEHAYQPDFGANATAYIDTFFRNINWEVVLKRIRAVPNDQPLPNEDPSSSTEVPSLSVDELAAEMGNGGGVQVIDARQRDHMSCPKDLMAGTMWRDPDGIDAWIGELEPDKPVAVYCAYGFDVGRNVAKTLIERGFDARFIRGGGSAWYALGGRALKP
jgi:Fe-Mn family superoxide dismutase